VPIIERKDPLTLLTSEIVIEAPSEVVWQVLVDFDSYSDWNPVEIEARGEAVVGAAFEHTGKLPGRRRGPSKRGSSKPPLYNIADGVQ
jgi:uncharacterized protein YegL